MALALTRREGESIHIGRDITVTVRRIDSNKVRLSIAAPDNVRILRDDIGKRTVEMVHCPGCHRPAEVTIFDFSVGRCDRCAENALCRDDDERFDERDDAYGD